MIEKTFTQKQFISKTWNEGGYQYRLVIDASMKSLAGQAPYFSMTGATQRRKWGRGRWWNESFGRQDEEVKKRLPQLAKYLQWQLVSTDGPMHYIANAIYWTGREKFNQEHFKSTIVYGAAEDDLWIDAGAMMVAGDKEVKEWLRNRLPSLMGKFEEDMTELFGERPSCFR